MSVTIEQSSQCPVFTNNKTFNFLKKDISQSSCILDNLEVTTRRVITSGYLFVAPPDLDFSLLSCRNKRWQRRYFTLYEDGYLTYSLDEHPETIPQEVINMNSVEEVVDGDEVTGNQFSIRLQKQSDSLFIKGTSIKEKKWYVSSFVSIINLVSRFLKSLSRKEFSRFLFSDHLLDQRSS